MLMWVQGTMLLGGVKIGRGLTSWQCTLAKLHCTPVFTDMINFLFCVTLWQWIWCISWSLPLAGNLINTRHEPFGYSSSFYHTSQEWPMVRTIHNQYTSQYTTFCKHHVSIIDHSDLFHVQEENVGQTIHLVTLILHQNKIQQTW